jgi:hypothetical protein
MASSIAGINWGLKSETMPLARKSNLTTIKVSRARGFSLRIPIPQTA